MGIYETQVLSNVAASLFILRFQKEVGTEFERNYVDEFHCTVTCFDLEGDEVKTCKFIEQGL